MKCKACNQDLRVVGNKFDSSLDTTDVYSVQTLACVNTKCTMYAGTDLNNPKNVETVKNKVN